MFDYCYTIATIIVSYSVKGVADLMKNFSFFLWFSIECRYNDEGSASRVALFLGKKLKISMFMQNNSGFMELKQRLNGSEEIKPRSYCGVIKIHHTFAH
jgi:hypothetical protein